MTSVLELFKLCEYDLLGTWLCFKDLMKCGLLNSKFEQLRKTMIQLPDIVVDMKVKLCEFNSLMVEAVIREKIKFNSLEID